MARHIPESHGQTYSRESWPDIFPRVMARHIPESHGQTYSRESWSDILPRVMARHIPESHAQTYSVESWPDILPRVMARHTLGSHDITVLTQRDLPMWKYGMETVMYWLDEPRGFTERPNVHGNLQWNYICVVRCRYTQTISESAIALVRVNN